MSDREELIGKVSRGGKAALVLNELDPYLVQMEKDIVYRMKNDFISRKHTPSSLECYMAELCCVDNLRVRLKGAIAGGMSAEKKLTEVEEDE